MKRMRTLSYSQMGSYTTCQKKFEYEYVDRLRLKRGLVQQSSLGDLVHHGIASALREVWAIQNETKKVALPYAAIRIRKALGVGIGERVDNSRQPVLMLEGDDTPIQDDWNELETEAIDIAWNTIESLELLTRRFVASVTVYDPDQGGVVAKPLIEFYISVPLTTTSVFTGIVDAVLYDKTEKRNVLYDWKVRNRFTTYDAEVLNGQLPLYQYVLNMVYEMDIASSVVYQIKDKAPQKPELLKNGKGLSRRNIVTTWEMYKQEVIEHGYNPNDYWEMQEKLSGVQFFEPIEITRTLETLMRFWGNAIAFSEATEHKQEYPMALGYPCRSCPFARLCRAKIEGYGEDEALEHYETVSNVIDFVEG